MVQAKDISEVEILEVKEDKRSVRLDGIRRIRKRRNYRERPLYVMDTRAFYMDVIDHCEELVLKRTEPPTQIGPLMEKIQAYEQSMEHFAMRNRRFAILAISIEPSAEIYQIANALSGRYAGIAAAVDQGGYTITNTSRMPLSPKPTL